MRKGQIFASFVLGVLSYVFFQWGKGGIACIKMQSEETTGSRMQCALVQADRDNCSRIPGFIYF